MNAVTMNAVTVNATTFSNSIDSYEVPVDPMDELQCESCQ